MNIALHKRQFCIARSRYEFGPDWCHIALPEGFVLSYQADLALRRIRNETGETTILGQCFSSVSGSMERGDLAGRFAILNWPYLQTDAAGLMALYYGGSELQPFVTSSPALAARLAEADQLPIQLKWRIGINWIPSPGSRVAGVARLMRDQMLEIPRLAVEFLPRDVTPSDSVPEAGHLLIAGLIHVFKQIEETHDKVYLALTAGLDSRTLFAALLAGGIKFEAITQRFPGVDAGDLRIPADLCRYTGVRHSIVPMDKPDGNAVAALRIHSADSSEGADGRYLIPGNCYGFLTKNAALIRGGCFEIGRRFYERKLGALGLPEATGEQLLFKFGPEVNGDMAQFLDEWLAWRRSHGNGLDLTDSFYLDQRLGGWLSAVEQRLDVLAGNSIQPVNCERFFSCLMTPEQEERRAGALQHDVIRNLDRNLLKVPINPVGFGSRLKNMARTSKRRVMLAMQRVLHSAMCISGLRFACLEEQFLETVVHLA